MKPFGEFFEIMLNSCCAFLGVNNNDFLSFALKHFTRITRAGSEVKWIH